jgi:hypothetical protein
MSENQKLTLGNITEAHGAIAYSNAYDYNRRTFNPYDGNISVRSETTRADYDKFRPGERVPKDPYSAMRMGLDIYWRVGVVYRVINLMSDFVSSGITLHHENATSQRLFRKWFKHVDGSSVSERLINCVLKCGNVYGYRGYSKVPMKEVKKMKSAGGVPKPQVRRIPTDYYFLNPLSVEPLGNELSTFIKDPVYVTKITDRTRTLITKLGSLSAQQKDSAIKHMFDGLPPLVLDAVKNKRDYVVLPKEDMFHFHYRKDDWDAVAYPMTYSVFENIMLLEKMHLADSSALDGAISNIRLWRLGYIDTKNPSMSVIPDGPAYQKLRDTLSHNAMGGVIDIIWGPELDFKESSTQVHNFLGSEKYTQVMSEIYEGLGIPPSLTGTGGSSNFNNNYVAMKAMMNTLEHLRHTLVKFWETEIKIVADALKLKPPKLRFQHVNFSDETVQNKLVMDLIDRDLISAEMALESFNFIPEIEKRRIIKEQKMRNRSDWDKSGPYHNNQKQHELKKLALQRGVVTPEEVGLELDPREDGNMTPMEMQFEAKQAGNKGGDNSINNFEPTGQQGRPPGSKDSQKRKTRDTLSPSFGGNVAKAINMQEKINDMLLQPFLDEYQLSNARKMSDEQKADFEKMKLVVFSRIPLSETVSNAAVYKIMSGNISIEKEFDAMAYEGVKQFLTENGRMPTVPELKYINATVKAQLHDNI